MSRVMLDTFCKAGGATKGYQRAGWYVVGIDIEPQPRYCGDEFIQADALEFIATRGREFDAIHASPPCQKYSSLTRVHGHEHADLIPPVRTLLQRAGVPYVIENVPGAPLRAPITLCGSMFGLGAICRDGRWRQLRRHRLFESPDLEFALLPSCAHAGEPLGVYGHGGGQAKTVWNGGRNRGYMGTREERRQAMAIDWMDHAELSQAIPPAYTEWIGRQLMAPLERAA